VAKSHFIRVKESVPPAVLKEEAKEQITIGVQKDRFE